MQGHHHNMDNGGAPGIWDSAEGDGGHARASGPSYRNRRQFRVTGPITDGTNDIPRVSKETRPKNVSLLYCKMGWLIGRKGGSNSEILNRNTPFVSSTNYFRVAGRPGLAEHFVGDKGLFEIIKAEISFARIRRPTDNAITERFYATSIERRSNDPDERSAREKVGRYVGYCNTDHPPIADELHHWSRPLGQ